MAVKLIVDSTSDIPEEYIREHGMHFIPMRVTFGTEEFLDGVTLSKQEFYQKLTASAELPRTSMINSYEYEQVFEQVKENGDTGIVITLSEKLSGTVQSARIAAEEYDNIYVVDSGQVTISAQILIRYAQQLIEQGKTAEEIVSVLNEKKSKINLVALVDTLEYLKKGGRISPAVALAGGVLKIKPVLGIRDGELIVLGKARGANAGNNLLNEKVRETGGIDFDMPCLLGYSGTDDSLLHTYIEGSRALWEGKLDYLPIAQIGCTIGTHAGPGAIAVAFFEK